ncbi:hypothetical protein N9F08_01280, partial [bacterium]|nr:hypothetical protein [bacterium]
MLNGHGDDLYNYPEIKYNFSSNVFYKGCSPELIDLLGDKLESCVNNYPSPTGSELSDLAADRYGVPSDHFLFFNGATEAFYTISHLFKGQTATIFAPTFAEYEGSCQVHDIKIQWSFRSDFDNPINTALAFLCNPN